MSYEVDGEQYAAVMAGYGGADLVFGPLDQRAAFYKYQNYGRILAFKLDGGPTPLPPKVAITKIPKSPEIDMQAPPQRLMLPVDTSSRVRGQWVPLQW
jgi:hypothetical protein